MDLKSPASEVHLSQYWHVIRKRWLVIVSIVTVVMAATWGASYLDKPVYTSKIRIQIERENPNQITIEDLFGIAASEQEFMQTQYILLKSKGLAQRVIEDHNLLSDPEFYPAGIAGKTPAEIKQIRDGMAGGLVGWISVSPVPSTSLVDISCVAPSPRLAQKVAEAWGSSYIGMSAAKKIDSVTQASEFLTRKIAAIQMDLDESRRALQQYGENKDIVAVTGDLDTMTVQRLTQLNADLGSAQADRVQKQAAYEALLRTPPATAVANDGTVARLNEDLSRYQREYQSNLATYRPAHPIMQQLTQQIEKTRSARDSAVRDAYERAKESARLAASAAASKEGQIRGAFDQQKVRTQRVNENIAGYVDLRMAAENKQALLATLQKQLAETEVAARLRGSSNSNIHWIEHAELPGGRANDSMKKNLKNAFPLGLALGLATVFFLEYMDRSVKTPEQMEQITGFASLGVIPAASSIGDSYGYASTYGRARNRLRAIDSDESPTHQVELIPHTDSRSPIAEAYRAFRTSLLLSSAKSPTVIVISSSVAREGKTTTAANLAVVLAQLGKPVLLIDADLRRPRLQKVFTGKDEIGLVNHLVTHESLENVTQPTEVPNLSVILSGPIPPNPSELLGSERMVQLIEKVRAEYAFVIFDSPPVMAVTDAVVLAASADGLVLCVHGGETARDLIQRAAERLISNNITVLGAVLNNLDVRQYGYSYRKSYYDYYHSEGAPEQQPPARKTV